MGELHNFLGEHKEMERHIMPMKRKTQHPFPLKNISANKFQIAYGCENKTYNCSKKI